MRHNREIAEGLRRQWEARHWDAIPSSWELQHTSGNTKWYKDKDAADGGYKVKAAGMRPEAVTRDEVKAERLHVSLRDSSQSSSSYRAYNHPNAERGSRAQERYLASCYWTDEEVAANAGMEGQGCRISLIAGVVGRNQDEREELEHRRRRSTRCPVCCLSLAPIMSRDQAECLGLPSYFASRSECQLNSMAGVFSEYREAPEHNLDRNNRLTQEYLLRGEYFKEGDREMRRLDPRWDKENAGDHHPLFELHELPSWEHNGQQEEAEDEDELGKAAAFTEWEEEAQETVNCMERFRIRLREMSERGDETETEEREEEEEGDEEEEDKDEGEGEDGSEMETGEEGGAQTPPSRRRSRSRSRSLSQSRSRSPSRQRLS